MLCNYPFSYTTKSDLHSQHNVFDKNYKLHTPIWLTLKPSRAYSSASSQTL